MPEPVDIMLRDLPLRPLYIVPRDELIGEASVSESALVHHTLECLAYLIATARLEIKVSFLHDGQFHDKVWFFSDLSGRVVVSGSSNLTRSGLARNHEQVRVERSWE